MILAHKTISEDELLHHYALLPWERLYVAQRAFEEQLATVLEAGGPDPWAAQPKSYIGLAKTKKVAELRSAGVSASVIADQASRVHAPRNRGSPWRSGVRIGQSGRRRP